MLMQRKLARPWPIAHGDSRSDRGLHLSASYTCEGRAINGPSALSGLARWESEIGRMRMPRQRARMGKSAMSFRGANSGLRRMTREITSERSARKRRGWPRLKAAQYDASNWPVIGGFNDGKVFTAAVGKFSAERVRRL